MEDCIFCKIISGDVPAYKIWENEEFLAILDVFPHKSGQVLVMPRRHMRSDVFKLSEEDYTKLAGAAAEVGRKMDVVLGSERTCLVFEGLGVNHAHAKLYPVRPGETVEGLVPLGVRADEKTLSEIAAKFVRGG